jgi:hypothetical protein
MRSDIDSYMSVEWVVHMPMVKWGICYTSFISTENFSDFNNKETII